MSIALHGDEKVRKAVGWVGEMYGFSIAACSVGLKFMLQETALMVHPPFEKEVGAASIIHYTYGTFLAANGTNVFADQARPGRRGWLARAAGAAAGCAAAERRTPRRAEGWRRPPCDAAGAQGCDCVELRQARVQGQPRWVPQTSGRGVPGHRHPGACCFAQRRLAAASLPHVAPSDTSDAGAGGQAQ